MSTEPTEEQLANRRVWLAALRSGNYRQARRVLRRNDSYCCLGVAEDVLDCVWQPVRNSSPSGLFVETHVATYPDLEGARVPPGVTSLTAVAEQRLGLPRVPWVVVPSRFGERTWVVTTLVMLNDDWRLPLEKIADVVEDQGELWTGQHDQAAAELARRNRRLARA